MALREAWARERDAALDREQSAASTRIRELSNRHAPCMLPPNVEASAQMTAQMLLDLLQGDGDGPQCILCICIWEGVS